MAARCPTSIASATVDTVGEFRSGSGSFSLVGWTKLRKLVHPTKDNSATSRRFYALLRIALRSRTFASGFTLRCC